MANDMTLTMNTLPAKGSGKEVRRTAESQSVSPQQGVDPVTSKQSVEETNQSGKAAAASSEISKEKLEGAVSQMKDFAQRLNRELQFDVDEDLGRMVVRVVDRDSGDLIRQIPSEEVMALASQMREMQEAEASQLDGKSLREQSVGLLVELQA